MHDLYCDLLHLFRHYTAYYSPTKRSENKQMTYTYYQEVPQSENFLSENEVSSV